MFYYRIKKGVDPIHPRFKKYVQEYATHIEDHEQHILVVPETRTEYLFRFPRIRKAIWWLSVDFFYDTADVDRWSTLMKMTGITKRYNLKKPDRLKIDLHLVQSHYAALHLEKHGITNHAPLSDYLNASFFTNTTAPVTVKENRVLYNPKKGLQFTQQLIQQAPDLNWLPLIDMTPDEVANACRTSKVYIDFGQHPGKDRFPREAAISGCCVITGKKGAAANETDIPISGNYKFADEASSIPHIIQQIQHCYTSYNTAVHDFDAYRSIIKEQEAEFNSQLQKIFTR
ncbi:hypothetical protein FLA_6219 [Filimonas lacunae]|nr:hypothetical protein FLA_6219 [Filimonas lacunae]